MVERGHGLIFFFFFEEPIFLWPYDLKQTR